MDKFSNTQRELFNRVHIWRYTSSIESFGASKFLSLERAYEILSSDEKIRLKKIKTDSAKHEFLFNRALLRLIIAEYTYERPNKIEFNYSKFGKPELKNNKLDLSFNLSHTNGYGIIAVSLASNLGVDVEEEKYDFSYEDIINNYFCSSEVNLIHSFSEAQRSSCFYELWTMKEAILKAAGTGLSYPMKDLDLSELYKSNKKTMHFNKFSYKNRESYEIYKIDTNNEKYHAFFAIENNEQYNHLVDYKNYQDIISDSEIFKSYPFYQPGNPILSNI